MQCQRCLQQATRLQVAGLQAVCCRLMTWPGAKGERDFGSRKGYLEALAHDEPSLFLVLGERVHKGSDDGKARPEGSQRRDRRSEHDH